MDVDYENTPKAVLQPKNPGERLKVAQTVLSRRDRNIQAAAQRARQIQQVRQQQKQAKKGKINVVRLENFVKESLNWKQDKRRLYIQSKVGKKYKDVNHSKTIIVGRNGRGGGSTETKGILRELNLLKRHTLVFHPNTKEVITKLNRVKPFVFWGRCSFKLVFNLIHKKARFRNPEDLKSKAMLNDNSLIEQHLGDLGVLCTEDLAHVLHTNGKHFAKVSERIWPMFIGNMRKANGLVHDKNQLFGLQQSMDTAVNKLIGE